MVTPTQQKRKKQKSERERKQKISKEFTKTHTRKKTGRLNEKDRLELARARAGAGQEHTIKDGKIVSKTPEERRQTEITATAQKGIDIQEEKKRLQTPTTPTAKNEELNKSIETGQFLKDRSEGAQTIETETIIQIDDAGFRTELQMPVGTMDKINAAKARREGRVPFNELPAYQQFLAQSIIFAVSPTGTIKGGKFINSGTKQLSKFMKTNLGKYVEQITIGAGIITWLASDNIIGTMSIYGRDLAEDVKWGATDPQTALRKFDEGIAFVEQGKNFIRTATILNPLLWPFRKIILANTEAASLSLEENRNRILKG